MKIIYFSCFQTALTAVSALPAVFLFDSEERAVEVILQLFSCEGNPTPKESVLLFNSVFAFLGAWAAAAVHPLDWDRWWQVITHITSCQMCNPLLVKCVIN